MSVTVTTAPDPAVLAHPLTYTIQFTNTLACDITDPFLILVPLITPSAQLNQFCQLISAATVEEGCNAVQTLDEANSVGDVCCRFTAFANAWPTACTPLRTGPPAPVTLQNFPFEDSLHRRGIHTNAAFSPSSLSAPSTLAGLSCTPASLGGGGVVGVDCTGTLAPGATSTQSITVTALQPGSFGNVILVGGNAPCGFADEFAEGGVCSLTTVAETAPAMSGSILIVLVLFLGAVAFRTLVPRSRRSIT
jgi:hypothetical protein